MIAFDSTSVRPSGRSSTGVERAGLSRSCASRAGPRTSTSPSSVPPGLADCWRPPERSAQPDTGETVMKRLLLVLSGLLALALPATALADPPPNDNRATAEQIPSFPATLHGTTLGATVERLDPQAGTCGASESTVWYRIDQAPDGLIRIAAHGDGFAPAVRVFRVGRSAISEVRCANASAGATAAAAFESVRGASFLVMVGKRPGTADGAFDLDASLFLPPANDHPG